MANKHTCIIVDDEPLARRLLVNYVQKTPELDLKGTFKSAIEAGEFLKSNKVDILFSDIQMPGLSGINFVESTNDLPAVIFTTAYEEYAVKAFELAVIDYLVKPFPIERFHQAVRKFTEYFQLKHGAEDADKHLIVKANHGFIRIPHNQILFVEAMGEYMKLILTEGLPELIYMRMKELEQVLGDGFIRIHKSFLVNKKKISKLSGNLLTVGSVELPVSRLYKAEVVKKMSF